MPMICDATTRIPYHHRFATHCRALRQLYGLHYHLGSLGGRNCATVWFMSNGIVRHVTCSSEATPGLGYAMHSERACFDDIQQELAQGATVIRVYTERFPCGPQNHNCLNFLRQQLDPLANPVRVYWTFPWPDASDYTLKHKRDDPDEYARAAKIARCERRLGSAEVKRAGAAVLLPGPWGTAVGEYDGYV